MSIDIIIIHKTRSFLLKLFQVTPRCRQLPAIFLGLITIMFIVTSCGCEEDRIRNDIYNDSLLLVDDCISMDNKDISIYGKVMVFDYDKTEFELFDYYPRYQYFIASLGDLAASPYDSEITVFIISTKRLGLVGSYEPGSGEAYRASFSIYVINWSKGKPLGMHTIVSNPPRAVSSGGRGRLGAVTGNVNDIIQWILKLPQDGLSYPTAEEPQEKPTEKNGASSIYQRSKSK